MTGKKSNNRYQEETFITIPQQNDEIDKEYTYNYGNVIINPMDLSKDLVPAQQFK